MFFHIEHLCRVGCFFKYKLYKKSHQNTLTVQRTECQKKLETVFIIIEYKIKYFNKNAMYILPCLLFWFIYSKAKFE